MLSYEHKARFLLLKAKLALIFASKNKEKKVQSVVYQKPVKSKHVKKKNTK